MRRSDSTIGVFGFAGAAALALLAGPAVHGQFGTRFEPPQYVGSGAGEDLNGQDDFYNPDPPNSVSADVYTYDANALGLPANPGGGAQFAAGTGPAGNMFARSQLDRAWGDGTGSWTVSFDVAITYTGVPPSTQNVGSFSTQPLTDPAAPGIAAFIALARWVDPNTGNAWNADYAYYDANNVSIIGPVPDPAFQNLLIDHWYRWCTTVDLDANTITEISITDLTTGETATHNPVGWFLGGGSAGGLPAPSGFRLFAGSGTAAGNTMAFDNLTILRCPWDLTGDGVVNAADLAELLGGWGPNPNHLADFDGNGTIDPADLAQLLGNWGPCPDTTDC